MPSDVHTLLIANPKGGSGKSTLATNLAGYLARQGARVMLADVDRQQSSREWLSLRPVTLPPIGSCLAKADEALKLPRGTTHAILDMPAGLHGKKLESVIKQVDRVIVPLQPSPFDISATRDFLTVLLEEKAVRKGRAYVAIVGNRVDPRTLAARQLENFLADFKLPVLSYLRSSQEYVKAAAVGLTLFDLPSSRGAKDRAQWQPILDWIKSPAS